VEEGTQRPLTRAYQQAVHDAALDAIVTVDEAGAIVEFNRAAEATFGYRRADVIGRRMVELLIPPALRAAHERGFRRHLATGESTVLGRRIELMALRSDGREFPIELSIVRLAQPGSPVFTAFIRDISERVRRDAAAAEAAAIVASSFDAIVGRTPDGTVTSWNASAERIFGYTAEEMIGSSLTIIEPQDRAGELEEISERLRLEGRLDPFETTRRCKDGRVIHVETTASPTTNGSGELVAVSSLSRDITDRKRSQLLLSAQATLLALVAAGRPLTELVHVLNQLLMQASSGGATAALITPGANPIEGATQVMGWESEILASDRALLGKLVMYYPGPCEPAEDDVKLAEIGLDAARIAIERLRAEEALRASEKRYRDLFENASEPIATVTLDNIITNTNATFQRTLGYTNDELVGTSLRDYLTDDGYNAAVREGERKLSGEVSVTSFEQEFIARDRTTVMMHVSSRIIEEDGRAVGIQATCRDITAHKQAQEQLVALAAANRHQALHDALTGLPNRTHFRERLAAAITSYSQGGSSFEVLMIDLSGFKQINDSFGHHCGDAVLRDLAVRLRGAVRESDTVARLGGDEFGVVITRPRDSGLLAGAVARVVTTLQKPVELDGVPVYVEANIGSARCPRDGIDSDLLLHRADMAMYDAKQKGFAHARFHADVPDEAASTLVRLAEIPRAIASRELHLVYQPQTALRTEVITNVEALVRWQHPTRGLIGPAEFIPAAERTALIEPLTAFILNDALAQSRRWRAAGLDVGISVNLSMRNLHDIKLPTNVESLLRKWGVPSNRLTLEITESAIASHPERAQEIIQQLSALGVLIAIDDFGVGYTSLAHLARLPINQLKIDRSFVTDLDTNSAHASIVGSTIALGHDLGVEVVAEGVETRAVRDKLELLNCDTIQGYLIGAPLPAEELEPRLRNPAEIKRPRASGAAA